MVTCVLPLAIRREWGETPGKIWLRELANPYDARVLILGLCLTHRKSDLVLKGAAKSSNRSREGLHSYKILMRDQLKRSCRSVFDCHLSRSHPMKTRHSSERGYSAVRAGVEGPYTHWNFVWSEMLDFLFQRELE